MAGRPAVSAVGLVKRLGGREVLRGLDLEVREGEIYAVMGPNGSGKSTLLRVLAYVLEPDGGRVEVFGRPPGEARRLFGYLPQEPSVSPLLTGRENVAYFAGLAGHGRREARRLAGRLLERVGLSGAAGLQARKYSGGMRRRLELATALLPGVRLLLLDEPTTGLDPAARRDLLSLLQGLAREEGMTVVMTTHIGSDVEAASRVGLLKEGKIVVEGTPEELRRAAGLKRVVHIEAEAGGAAHLLEGLGEVVEVEGGYRIYCDDPEEALPRAVRALEAAGHRVVKASVEEPTMEDIYHRLVGR